MSYSLSILAVKTTTYAPISAELKGLISNSWFTLLYFINDGTKSLLCRDKRYATGQSTPFLIAMTYPDVFEPNVIELT
jgi:hypothetical protein